jgi:CheY-specific phosphatase CheX
MNNNYPPARNWNNNANRPGAPKPPLKSQEDLRAKYQLAPQPANVKKIAGLANGRESATMEEITEIISTDSGVTQRLMTLAYPRQTARLGATVQMATSRLGVNRVIVVMVGDLLTKAVIETFETMLSMKLEIDDPTMISLADHGYLTGTVRFKGENNGQVTLAFSPHLSLVLATTLLGCDLDEEQSPETINDTIGELVNIVTGNLQSKLCDAQLRSEVGLPEVKFEQTLPKEEVPGGSFDQFYFRSGMHTLVVSLSIDPSKPKAPMTKGNSWRANGP